MISNNKELEVMLERIRRFQKQVEKLRQVETNPENYRSSVKGYLAEIDRMNLEVREYLLLHPSELTEQAA
jgi:Na+/phosphate symporter